MALAGKKVREGKLADLIVGDTGQLFGCGLLVSRVTVDSRQNKQTERGDALGLGRIDRFRSRTR